MSDSLPPLPAAAVAALAQGHKIEAIKAVREAEGLGLKEAKDRVEAYVACHPELQANLPGVTTVSLKGCAVFLPAVVGLGVYFAGGFACPRNVKSKPGSSRSEASMVLTESPKSPLGSPCPDFTLPGVDGRTWRREDFLEPALLVVVMCNHCPYVQAVDDRINQLAKDFRGRCGVVGINPNDAVAYPDDGFEPMVARARAKGYVFPYLRDETLAVARSLGAVCTPDFFLYGADRRLCYRGRLDDNWKEPADVTRQELRQAIEALLAGAPVPTPQHPSMGCSIKWKG